MIIYNSVRGKEKLKMLQKKRADIDQNEAVTLTDALLILNYLAKQEEKPAEPEKPSEIINVSSADIKGNKVVVEGETTILEADIYPKNATYKDLEWYSKDESIAKVDLRTGEVTGLKAGEEATIILKIDGKEVDKYPIEVVEKEITNIKISKEPLKKEYNVGETIDTKGLELEVRDNTGTTTKITSGYTVSPEKATKEGTQIITVNYKGKTITYNVTVKGEVVKFKVDTSSGGKVDLMLRELPGTSAKVIERLAHGSYVYTTKGNLKEVTNANGYEWIHVTSESGKQGFVAKKYLKEYNGKKYESEFDSYDIKVNHEGTISGYLGIDVAPGGSVTKDNFEKIIKGQLAIPGTTIGRTDIANFSPAFVYLKFGATGWGKNFSIAKSTTYEDVEDFIKICEKYKIPYGGYYYSQAITMEEARKEAEYIKGIYSKAEKNIGKLQYNVLPFAIDIELGGSSSYTGRMLQYIKNGGKKSELTKVKNFLINEVEKIEQVDKTIIYTDRNTLRELIILEDFDKEHQELWMVDPIEYPTHSKDIVNKGYGKYIKNRQIKLDYSLNRGCCLDINLMNKDIYEELIQQINT